MLPFRHLKRWQFKNVGCVCVRVSSRELQSGDSRFINSFFVNLTPSLITVFKLKVLQNSEVGLLPHIPAKICQYLIHELWDFTELYNRCQDLNRETHFEGHNANCSLMWHVVILLSNSCNIA